MNEIKNKHRVKGGKIGGRSKSAAKRRASRANGKLGGRPRSTSPVRSQIHKSNRKKIRKN